MLSLLVFDETMEFELTAEAEVTREVELFFAVAVSTAAASDTHIASSGSKARNIRVDFAMLSKSGALATQITVVEHHICLDQSHCCFSVAHGKPVLAPPDDHQRRTQDDV